LEEQKKIVTRLDACFNHVRKLQNSYTQKAQELKAFKRSILKQADPSLPMVVTMAWTVEDLLFLGHAFWVVLETDPADGRPSQARRIDPMRVTFQVDAVTGQIVDGFYIDGYQAPLTGIGSIIMFSGTDEGILTRGGRTIQTALALEKAAARMADEPTPSMVIKNTGVDLPPEQVTNLLSAWKTARATRSTAYLSGPLDVTAFGFDPASLQLVEARQHTASEVARMCGIPAWYLNAESASATYSNVSAERRSLVDFSLKPIMATISERLSMNDMTPRGQVVRFNLDDYLRGNPLEQVEVIGKMLELNLIDVTEGRALMDLAPRGMA
jgi:HK97 family phage portal protein